MPYTIKWLKRGLIWTYSGILTGNELLQSNFDIYGDARFDDIRYQIVDLRAVETTEVNPAEMRKIAYTDMAAARINPRIKIAVVSPDPNQHFMMDTYDKYTEGKSPWLMKVFATLEEATEWAET